MHYFIVNTVAQIYDLHPGFRARNAIKICSLTPLTLPDKLKNGTTINPTNRGMVLHQPKLSIEPNVATTQERSAGTFCCVFSVVTKSAPTYGGAESVGTADKAEYNAAPN